MKLSCGRIHTLKFDVFVSFYFFFVHFCSQCVLSFVYFIFLLHKFASHSLLNALSRSHFLTISITLSNERRSIVVISFYSCSQTTFFFLSFACLLAFFPHSHFANVCVYRAFYYVSKCFKITNTSIYRLRVAIFLCVTRAFFIFVCVVYVYGCAAYILRKTNIQYTVTHRRQTEAV